MPLTAEHKKIILDYVLPSGSFSKGILEDTEVGEAYEEGTVTKDDIYEFLDEVRTKSIEALKE